MCAPSLKTHGETDMIERRITLVARKLAKYNIQIVAFDKIRLANESKLIEIRAGYTYIWSGHESSENQRLEPI
jgi:hypothetical protein